MELSKRMSETELAYQILLKNGKNMYFRDLISGILEKQGKPVFSQSQAMAEIHTQINMDSRFVYHSKGMWGLAEWAPQRRGAETEPELSAKEERDFALEEINHDDVAVSMENYDD